ncbi:MAG: type II toxin-antitoxin system Phd/YefM family antitoxin [Gammaproteobacteria bacterium]|nr:type II toxin-antitoxin system Phd/YefM family antitoxin [Gammaproteobacteria bacterium]
MLKVSASDFKAHCLQYMALTQNQHEIVIITKHGTPVAQLIPFQEQLPSPIFGRMQGTIEIHDDIIQPIDVDWDMTE